VAAVGFQELFRGEDTDAAFAAAYLMADTMRLIREFLTRK
jgi:hypothetical protein